MRRFPRLPLSVCSNSPPSTAPTTDTTLSRLSQALALGDGRVLGYAEYGCQNGFPLLYFHGYPSSRLEGWAIDAIARRRGLHLIVPDRPGYGLSTFQHNRRITDWPADVEALVDHLRISRFAVLGCSGGGPYALACARALPHEMVSAVGILSGAGPWAAGMQYISLPRRLLSVAATRWPTALKAVVDGLVGVFRWCLTTGLATKRLDNWLRKQDDQYKGNLSMKEQREKLLAILFEGFAQGAAATVQEAGLLSHDWGFRFEDVTYDKIQIWHGEKDANSPVQLIRYMAERLPHCELREFPGETHYSLIHHLDEILSELVPEEVIRKHSSATL